MIRRTIAAVGLAGGLALIPAAAYAYTAPSPDTTSTTGVQDENKEAQTLSSTGFENAPMALGAGVLLVAGAATVVVAARRTSAGNQS